MKVYTKRSDSSAANSVGVNLGKKIMIDCQVSMSTVVTVFLDYHKRVFTLYGHINRRRPFEQTYNFAIREILYLDLDFNRKYVKKSTNFQPEPSVLKYT